MSGGSLVWKAPRHVDIHYRPLRFCVVARNTSGLTFGVRGQRWGSGEHVLHHGDELVYNEDRPGCQVLKLVLRCARAPWEMPLLPVYEPPAPPQPPPPRQAPPVPTSLERMLGLPAGSMGEQAARKRPLSQPTLADLKSAERPMPNVPRCAVCGHPGGDNIDLYKCEVCFANYCELHFDTAAHGCEVIIEQSTASTGMQSTGQCQGCGSHPSTESSTSGTAASTVDVEEKARNMRDEAHGRRSTTGRKPTSAQPKRRRDVAQMQAAMSAFLKDGANSGTGS